MIPTADVTPTLPDPLPSSFMPDGEDLTGEGFGDFHESWGIGHVAVEEAAALVRYEAEVIEALDRAAGSTEDFEVLAQSLEDGETEGLSESQLLAFSESGLAELAPAPDDAVLLGGLEVGVSGLAHALVAIGCPTAASCRSHAHARSWSDCPVVFFACADTQMKPLAELIAGAGCGLGEERSMLKIYAPSIRETNALAGLILAERGRLGF